MKRNPKQGPFDLSIDLTQIPSFKARFGRVDPNGDKINLEMKTVSTKVAQDAEKDLRAKFGTGTDPRSLPSIILRRQGKRV